MHEFSMPHFPRFLTWSLLSPSYVFRQSNAHSRPSSRQSLRHLVVRRHVESCAHALSSGWHDVTKHPRTRLFSARTSLLARIAPHQPSEHGVQSWWPLFFTHLPLVADAPGASAAKRATTSTSRARALSL